MTFECVKNNKRLWIKNTVTGELVYTHPDFIRLTDRTLMQTLAERATVKGKLAIEDIMVFEAKAPRAPGVRKRPPEDEPDWIN